MRGSGAAVFLAGAALLVAAAPPPDFAQGTDPVPPPQAPAGWTAPHTPWGDPDLRGTWPLDLGRTTMQRNPRFGDQALYTDEQFEAAAASAADAAKNADREDAVNKLGPGNWFETGKSLRQTSLITEPADGRIHMNEEGMRRAKLMRSSWSEKTFDSIADFNSLDRCITRGLPATMIPFPYNNGLVIFQSPGYVAINLELIHETRLIPLGEKPQLPGALRPWLGSSRGHFEGDTLVVETTNFNGETPMVIVGPSNMPIPTSTSMKIVEHFTPKGPNTIYYEAWVNDPVVLAEPFKMAFPLTRDESYEPFEYACHEGNTLLRGYIQATSPRYAEYRKEHGGSE